MSPGTIHGVGVGPGDPELMSVRADRLVRSARHVGYFRKAGRKGHARGVVDDMLRPDVVEIPMEYPVTTEIPVTDPAYNEILSSFYVECSGKLLGMAESGADVVVLCEGDPFFYGSFMHLYVRLQGRAPVSVVPAITGMSAAWTVIGQPVTWGDDALTVLMGTLPEATLAEKMSGSDALVVMKVGRNIEKIRNALRQAGKYDAAWLVEYASMSGQTAMPLSRAEGKAAPYFSIVIVHGHGRRP